MSGVFLGFVGGVIAWFATNFIGQPLVAFIAARNEAARALAQYAELDGRFDPERDEFSDDIVKERTRALSAAGAQLIALANAYQILIPVLRRLKFRPQYAGNDLIYLSQMEPNGTYNEEIRGRIMKALRLGRRFGSHRI